MRDAVTYLLLNETTCFSAVRTVSAVTYATTRARIAKNLYNMFIVDGFGGEMARILAGANYGS